MYVLAGTHSLLAVYQVEFRRGDACRSPSFWGRNYCLCVFSISRCIMYVIWYAPYVCTINTGIREGGRCRQLEAWDTTSCLRTSSYDISRTSHLIPPTHIPGTSRAFYLESPHTFERLRFKRKCLVMRFHLGSANAYM